MSEWKKTYLRDLIVIKNGKDHKKLKNGPYPVYGSGGIMRYADSYLYDQESVLLPRKGTLNNIQFVTEPFWTVDTCYYTVVNRDKVLPYFLYCCLCKMDIQSLNTGSAVPSMTFEKYYSIEVPIPPLSTQHCIANILSRYDSLIENYQKQIKLLEEAAQRLYKEWFVDLRFPGHENTKIIDGVPEGWEKKKLHEIAEVVMGSSPKSEFYNNDKQGLPFHQGVGSYGTRFVDDNVYSTSITRLAEPNSILFSVRAPVGRLNITKNKIIIGRGLAAMNHKDGFQSFLFYMLKERFFMDNIIGNGSIFASISKVELLDQEFIVPPMKTIKAFESLASKLDKKIQGVDTQLRLLTEARDRLLPKLMSGEIAV